MIRNKFKLFSVRFYENSLILMALTIIQTVLLRKIKTFKKSAPNWLCSSTSLIIQSKAGQLLLLSILDPRVSAFLDSSAEDNADLADTTNSIKKISVSSNKGDSTWSYLTLLIGWITFIVIFFIYLVMFAIFLPKNPTIVIDESYERL